ncbi:MAG: hypothetical protein R3C40_03815 [Parvularculaceae bacterium]
MTKPSADQSTTPVSKPVVRLRGLQRATCLGAFQQWDVIWVFEIGCSERRVGPCDDP